MKKVLLMFAFIATLLVGSIGTAGAQVNYTVYDGTGTSNYVPVEGLYTGSRLKCEYVIPADHLTAINGSTISKLTYYLTSSASAAWTCNFQVFVKEVASPTISDFSGMEGSTLVYEGTLDATSSTMEVVFSTPYTYNGGNLLIGFYNTNTGNYKAATFAGQTITGASVQGHNSNFSSITAAQKSFIPKTTFTVDQLHGCLTPTNLAVSDITPYGATVTWTPGNTETAWVVKFNDNEYPVSGTPSYTVTGLTPETDYVASVKAVCGDTEESEYTTPGVLFTTLPTCPAPTGVTVSNITSTSADVAWTENVPASAWTIDYNGTEIPADSNPFTLTGLTPATNYTVKVKANCAADDESDWSAIATFATACDALTLTETESYSEDFDSYTATSQNTANGVIPTCWGTISNGTNANTHPRVCTSYVPSSGSNGLNFRSGGSTYQNCGTINIAYLPEFTNPQGAVVSFAYRMENASHGTLYVGYVTDIDDVNSFVSSESVTSSTTASNAEIIIPATIPAGARIALKWEDNSTSFYDCGIDNIVVNMAPTCPKPTGITVSNITTTSADIAWTNGGTETDWVVKINDNEYPVSGTPSYTVTGLNPSTEYTVNVKAVCGEDDESQWSNTTNFATECGTFMVTETTPYFQGFESTAFPPTCWSRNHTAGTSTNTWIRTTSSTSVHQGTGAAQLQDQNVGNRNDLVTSLLNIPEANTYQVDFWMYRSTYSSLKPNEGVKVWVNTTPDTVGATEIMYIHREYTLAPAESATGWYEYSAVIPTSGDMYVIFQGISEYGAASYIDDITVNKAPTCFKPTDVVIVDSLTTSNSAVVDWTPAGDEEQWQVACNGDTTLVSAHPFTITGLEAASVYTVSVRAYCSDEDQSYWTAGTEIVTECAEVVVVTAENPYHEGWEEDVICWGLQQLAGTGNWNLSYEAYEGDYAVYFPYTTGADGLLISPVFDLSQVADPELSFAYWTNNWEGTCDQLYVYYRTEEDTVWNLIASFTTPMEDYDVATYQLPNPTSAYRIAFRGVGMDGNNVYLDDINITGEAIVEPCEVPANVTVENNVVTWESEAENFNLMYIVAEDTTTVEVAGNTYTFEGLEDSAVVTVMVQAVCDEDNTSDWSEAVEFVFTTPEDTIGIRNYTLNANVYPNPAHDVVNVECSAIGANLSVYDMFGKVVMNTTIQSERTELNLSNVAPGVYMIRIANDNAMTTVKVVKK